MYFCFQAVVVVSISRLLLQVFGSSKFTRGRRISLCHRQTSERECRLLVKSQLETAGWQPLARPQQVHLPFFLSLSLSGRVRWPPGGQAVISGADETWVTALHVLRDALSLTFRSAAGSPLPWRCVADVPTPRWLRPFSSPHYSADAAAAVFLFDTRSCRYSSGSLRSLTPSYHCCLTWWRLGDFAYLDWTTHSKVFCAVPGHSSSLPHVVFWSCRLVT